MSSSQVAAVVTEDDPDPVGEWLRVRGARVHNLRGIDVDLPKNALVVVCGLSGSGKSSLAFDTIFAEGQRRYVESLSAYARQFLGQVGKPDVDSIEGLSPAVSIDQKSTSHNPRSTVGTVTEIWDHLRLLFARAGAPHCPGCSRLLEASSPSAAADQLLAATTADTVTVLAPMVRRRRGAHTEVFAMLADAGFSRVRIDGDILRIDEAPTLDGRRPHTVEAVVDRVPVDGSRRQRLVEALETAFSLADGFAQLEFSSGRSPLTFSSALTCPDCLISAPPLEPRSFSFNSPYGACEVCSGLGSRAEVAVDLVITDPSLSINQGVLLPWHESSGAEHFASMCAQVCGRLGGDGDTPWSALPDETRQVLLEGNRELQVTARFGSRSMFREYSTTFEGVVPWLRRRAGEASSEALRERFGRFFTATPCTGCSGSRLRPESASVLVAGRTITSLAAMPVRDLRLFFEQLTLEGRAALVAERVLREVRSRLGFLDQVGLGYLTLDRSAASLSGGEAQRIRLATQIGSGLTGVLYVLDEPSIGLHQRDNDALLATLRRLRDLGNTVIVVEHDEDTLMAADWVLEIGPRAGSEGGSVVYSGPVGGLASCAESVTGAYLSGRARIDTPSVRRNPDRGVLAVVEPRGNNLQAGRVEFPIGTLTVVTGVSGSGKSTLVNDTLAAALARKLHRAAALPAKHTRVEGLELVDKLVVVDQSPIGRTPRSNPATYTGVFDLVRKMFAELPESKVRGYQAGRFSFNVPRKGRCETCEGEGTLRVEMNFLPDVFVTCEVCDGKRFNRETLEVTYKGSSIADVLSMRIVDAHRFFDAVPSIKRYLNTLVDVGLGYIALGQPATTLSGGEAQRVKLASELLRRPTGRTVYVLDEPTVGLHTDDIARLLKVLDRLVDSGNTVIVVEHNLDVVRYADHVIDLGPDGGPDGGLVVAAGTPEAIAACEKSITGRFLSQALATAADRAAGN